MDEDLITGDEFEKMDSEEMREFLEDKGMITSGWSDTHYLSTSMRAV